MDEEVKRKILAAIANSKFKWRTVSGISRETGIPEEEVTEFVEHSNDVIRSAKDNERGQALYTTITSYQSNTPLINRIISAATNKRKL